MVTAGPNRVFWAIAFVLFQVAFSGRIDQSVYDVDSTATSSFGGPKVGKNLKFGIQDFSALSAALNVLAGTDGKVDAKMVALIIAKISGNDGRINLALLNQFVQQFAGEDGQIDTRKVHEVFRQFQQEGDDTSEATSAEPSEGEASGQQEGDNTSEATSAEPSEGQESGSKSKKGKKQSKSGQKTGKGAGSGGANLMGTIFKAFTDKNGQIDVGVVTQLFGRYASFAKGKKSKAGSLLSLSEELQVEGRSNNPVSGVKDTAHDVKHTGHDVKHDVTHTAHDVKHTAQHTTHDVKKTGHKTKHRISKAKAKFKRILEKINHMRKKKSSLLSVSERSVAEPSLDSVEHDVETASMQGQPKPSRQGKTGMAKDLLQKLSDAHKEGKLDPYIARVKDHWAKRKEGNTGDGNANAAAMATAMPTKGGDWNANAAAMATAMPTKGRKRKNANAAAMATAMPTKGRKRKNANAMATAMPTKGGDWNANAAAMATAMPTKGRRTKKTKTKKGDFGYQGDFGYPDH